MKIYIQDKKIRTRRIASCLFEPRQFRWSSARFKARAEKDVAEAKIQMQMGNFDLLPYLGFEVMMFFPASDRVKDVECKYA